MEVKENELEEEVKHEERFWVNESDSVWQNGKVRNCMCSES